MPVTIEFDETIGRLAGGATELQVDGKSVQDVLVQVARQYASLRLFNCEGEMRSIVRVTRDGAPVALADAVADGDRLRLAVKA